MINDKDEDYIEHEVQIRMHSAQFEKIDKRFEKIDSRFEKIDKRFESMQNHMNMNFHRLDSKIDSHFKWTIGIMITMFGGLILTKFL
jgi:tetrahydromethanopterin S-methyltransferase subunit G